MTQIGKQEFPKPANSVVPDRGVVKKLIPTNPDRSNRQGLRL
jgi:hypothetical protein